MSATLDNLSAGREDGSLRAALPFVVAGLVLWGALYFFEVDLGLGLVQWGVVSAGLVVAAYVTWSSGTGFSFPFWVTATAIVLFLVEYVIPNRIVDAVPVGDVLAAFGLNINLAGLDPIRWAVIAVITVVAYWAVQYRAGSGSNRADSIADQIFGSGERGREGSLTKLVGQYITLGRILAGFALAIFAALAGQAGEFTAEVVAFASNAPLVASNAVTGVTGYFALGGSLPEWLAWIPGSQTVVDSLGGVGPTAFLLVFIAALALAYGTREELV